MTRRGWSVVVLLLLVPAVVVAARALLVRGEDDQYWCAGVGISSPEPAATAGDALAARYGDDDWRRVSEEIVSRPAGPISVVVYARRGATPPGELERVTVEGSADRWELTGGCVASP